MRGDVTPAWTLIIVPPKLTLSPKRVGVKMRWLRMFAMLMVAVLSVSWMSVTTDARIADMTADRLAEEQRATLALRDTLLAFRTASAVEAAKLEVVGGKIAQVPKNWKELRGRDAEVALNLVDALDEHDDVTHVYVDFDVPEEELRRIAGE